MKTDTADTLAPKPVVDTLTESIQTLGKTDRGRRVLSHLYKLLDEGGTALDANGERAVVTLLQAAWNGRAGSVLTSLESAMSIKVGGGA